MLFGEIRSSAAQWWTYGRLFDRSATTTQRRASTTKMLLVSQDKLCSEIAQAVRIKKTEETLGAGDQVTEESFIFKLKIARIFV